MRRRRRLLPRPPFEECGDLGAAQDGYRPGMFTNVLIESSRDEEFEAFERLGPKTREALRHAQFTPWSAVDVLFQVNKRRLFGPAGDQQMAEEIIARDYAACEDQRAQDDAVANLRG